MKTLSHAVLVWATALALAAPPAALAQATPKQSRGQAEQALGDMNRQAGGAVTACSLVTSADVQRATGRKPYGEPEAAGKWVCDIDVGELKLYNSWDGWEQTLKAFKKDKEPRPPAPAFGARAHFLFPKPDNQHQGTVAFLAAQAGAHTVALSLDAPKGQSAESMKPALEALMKAALARLPK